MLRILSNEENLLSEERNKIVEKKCENITPCTSNKNSE